MKKIFSGIESNYIIHHYVYGGFFFAILMFAPNGPIGSIQLSLCFVSWILYPFAMYIYDSIVTILIGDSKLITNPIVVLIWKLIKTALIFGLAIFVVLFGMPYLYFKNVGVEEAEDQ